MLVLTACGGEVPSIGTEDVSGSQESALTSAVSRGCTFTLTAEVRPGTMPPIRDLSLHRLASESCAWPAASLQLAFSAGFTLPTHALTANELGVAVGYTVKPSSAGGPYSTLGFLHADPEFMTVVRRSQMLAYNPLSLTSLTIGVDGTTLTGSGTKSGGISGETGSGNHFEVMFPDFFTSTTPGTIVAY
ncbi:hypothetical protein ACLEPN_02920 [Myxococcus sp. 1LA]